MLNLVKDLLAFGKATAAAGTPIVLLVPFRKRLKTWLTYIVYTAGSTAHVLTVLKPLGRTTLTANAAAGQAVLSLASDPSASSTGSISANDYLVVEQNDETCVLVKASSIAGLNLTVGSNLANGVSAGRRVWYFGTPAATGHVNLDTTASQANKLGGVDSVSGLCGADNREDPLLVYSPNATAAGIFEQVNVAYLKTGEAV